MAYQRDMFDTQMDLMDQLHNEKAQLFASSEEPSFTPVVERKPVITWANITCGEDCWNATCIDCRCSCGGINHGIYKRTGKRPDRTCREGHVRYKLAAVIHFAGSIRFHNHVNDYFTSIAKAGAFHYDSRDHGCAIHYGYHTKVKCCTTTQLKWPEFQNAVTPASWSSKQEKCNEATRSMFYGLWVDVDANPAEVAAAIAYANSKNTD